MARRSEVLEVKKDQSTWHSVFFTALRHKKKLTHRTEEESTRPGLRQDSLWQCESDCEQVTNSAEMARDSLGAFELFPLSDRLK